MKHDTREELLREAASRYMEQYGRELLGEMAEQDPAEITPSLDRKVHARIRAHKLRGHSRWIGPLAACVVIALLVPGLLRLDPGQPDAAAATEDADAHEADDTADAAGPFADAGMEYAADDGAGWEILPLGFDLPAGFSVAEVEQDREKTVYSLDNTALDDVVMTLQTQPGEIVYDDLTAISLGDATVYGAAQADYKLLAFESGGIHYVLTCRHDINTLTMLAAGIV